MEENAGCFYPMPSPHCRTLVPSNRHPASFSLLKTRSNSASDEGDIFEHLLDA